MTYRNRSLVRDIAVKERHCECDMELISMVADDIGLSVAKIMHDMKMVAVISYIQVHKLDANPQTIKLVDQSIKHY